ncbi:nuclear transport factor 2 family protein [Dyadobacter soli]|uniref:nuclear transport factor 2 family protein n=1 Tax=Dyadobacter soli TaxID=659014 RepID=UPI000B7DF6CB|nr:nuclear transport factor 2 family protein [Dyadobacter soli]
MESLEQILEMEKRLLRAMIASNVSELELIISDQAIVVGPDGRLSNKTDDIAAHRNGLLRILTMEPQETTTQVLSEEVIVVLALMEMRGTYQNQAFGGRFRYTRVWQKRDESWQIVTAHISSVLS